MYDSSRPLILEPKKPGMAGKVCKLIGGLLTLLIVILVGLSLFIRFYLTEERLKGMILPPAETALARTVTMGNIDVGLFSGITIRDLAVKEADNSADFLTMNKFVLHYNLLPLLQKKLIISEVVIDQPSCRVHRDKTGRFNFESLAVLADKPATSTKPASSSAAALPIALTVDRVTISKAHLTVSDAQKELPAIDATASSDITVTVGTTLADLQFRGDFNFVADIIHGAIKPHLNGKGTFDNRSATCTLAVDIDQQRFNIVAGADNLLAKPLPPLKLDISAATLNIDTLLAMTEKLPQPAAAKKGRKTPAAHRTTAAAGKQQPKSALAAGLPPGLNLTGSVKVDKALYKKLAVRDFSLAYTLQNGVATISALSFKTAGGTIAGKAKVDLTKADPDFSGALNIAALQLQELLANFVSPQANILSGGMATELTFSGRGFTTDLLKKHLNLEATYGMQGAQLAETPISATIARVLQIEALRNLALNNVDGNLHIKNGVLNLHSELAGNGIKAQTDGTVGINDGRLNLPLKLEFSGAMAEQLRNKASFLKYLSSTDGVTALNLKLTGTTEAPKAALDQAAVEKQVKEQLKQKITEEIGKKIFGTPQNEDSNDAAAPAKRLFKGLFGN